MRRILSALMCLSVGTALLGVTPTVAGAANSGQSVTGGGITGGGFGTRFGLTAHAKDGRVNGHATLQTVDGDGADRRGQVICLTVSGNRAAFAIADEVSGTNLQFQVQDLGNPVDGQSVDRIRGDGYDGCQIDGDPGNVLANGNIEVRG